MEQTRTGRDPSTGRTLAVRIRDDRIAGIEPVGTDEPLWLSPGLIDLQTCCESPRPT